MDNVLTHFDMIGAWEGRAVEAANALLSLGDPEMNMELWGSLQTLDTYLASFIGEPETADDDIDPNLLRFRRQQHADYLPQFNKAIDDYYEKRNELREAERLAQAVHGVPQNRRQSLNNPSAPQVGDNNSHTISTGPKKAISNRKPASYPDKGISHAMTVYAGIKDTGINGGGDDREDPEATGAAPMISGFMLFATPMEVLETSYAIVLLPQVVDQNKQQENDVIRNIAMNMPQLQGDAVQRLIDIILTPAKVSSAVKTYALETLITVAERGYPKAKQGLMTLIDDAYALAKGGSDWEYDVLEIIAKKAKEPFSSPADEYLQQLNKE